MILESETIREMKDWTEAAIEDNKSNAFFSSELFRLGYKEIQTRLDESPFL